MSRTGQPPMRSSRSRSRESQAEDFSQLKPPKEPSKVNCLLPPPPPIPTTTTIRAQKVSILLLFLVPGLVFRSTIFDRTSRSGGLEPFSPHQSRAGRSHPIWMRRERICRDDLAPGPTPSPRLPGILQSPLQSLRLPVLAAPMAVPVRRFHTRQMLVSRPTAGRRLYGRVHARAHTGIGIGVGIGTIVSS